MATDQATVGTDREGNTAPGPLPENLYGDLPDFEFRLWPSSTQVIMASMFLALGFTVSFQFIERIDVAITGGTAAPVATLFHPIFNMTGGVLFGLTGALIVANVNPLVANLTASSPLAPVFFATNMLYAVPVALLAWYFKTPGKGLTAKQLGIAHFIAEPLEYLPIMWLHLFVVDFSMNLALTVYVIHVVIGWASFFVAYPFVKKLLEAGVVPN